MLPLCHRLLSCDRIPSRGSSSSSFERGALDCPRRATFPNFNAIFNGFYKVFYALFFLLLQVFSTRHNNIVMTQWYTSTLEGSLSWWHASQWSTRLNNNTPHSLPQIRSVCVMTSLGLFTGDHVVFPQKKDKHTHTHTHTFGCSQ